MGRTSAEGFEVRSQAAMCRCDSEPRNVKIVYLSECQQEVPVISDYLTGRLLWFIFVLSDLLLHLQGVGFTVLIIATHIQLTNPSNSTCFLTAKPAPLPKPAKGFADLPPGRKDKGRRETSSASIVPCSSLTRPWISLSAAYFRSAR